MCGITFDNELKLEGHEKNHLSASTTTYSCEICKVCLIGKKDLVSWTSDMKFLRFSIFPYSG